MTYNSTIQREVLEPLSTFVGILAELRLRRWALQMAWDISITRSLYLKLEGLNKKCIVLSFSFVRC